MLVVWPSISNSRKLKNHPGIAMPPRYAYESVNPKRESQGRALTVHVNFEKMKWCNSGTSDFVFLAC